MRICLETGTIYYENNVVIKHGMTPSEVMKLLGNFYPNPETACLAKKAWFPVLPSVQEGLRLKVDVRNNPIKEVYVVVPRIKFPKPKDQQLEHIKNVVGEELFDLLVSHDNSYEFVWGNMRLFWNGRDEEMTLHICYR